MARPFCGQPCPPIRGQIATHRTDRPPPQPSEITQKRARESFTGEPQTRRWLIKGVFPLAQAALVAAGGGVGKFFMLLALAHEVAAFDGTWANAPTLLGGALAGQGVAIYVTAEDDAIEVHNRLNAPSPIASGETSIPDYPTGNAGPGGNAQPSNGGTFPVPGDFS